MMVGRSVIVLVVYVVSILGLIKGQANKCENDCGANGKCVGVDIPGCVNGTDINNCQTFKCACSYGWTGTDCTLEYETCKEKITTSPDPSAIQCFNGGRCESYNLDKVEEDETALVGTRCNCQSLPTDTIAYAGHQCEFAAEKVCIRGSNHSTFAFCVNGGSCVEFIEDNDPDQKLCDCPTGYGGRHCQYKLQDSDGDGKFDPTPADEIKYINIIIKGNETITIPPSSSTKQQSELSGGKKFFVVLIVLGLCTLLCYFTYKVMKRRRQNNAATNQEKGGSTTSRTDDPDREIL